MFKTFGFMVAAMSLAACGGDGATGGHSFYCTVNSGTASQECVGYKNISSQVKTAETQACTQDQGTVVSSCPSTSLVGCCTYESSGIETVGCYYSGTASDLMNACTSSQGGSWSTSAP